MKTCNIQDCKNKHHGKGYCKTHYNKHLLIPNQDKCSVLDCNNIIGKYGAKNLCTKHYTRLKRYGDINKTLQDRRYPSFDTIKLLYPDTYLNYEISNRSHWGKVCKQYHEDKCFICGWNITSCDADHIIPRLHGGKNTISNCQILCPNHHAMKHRNCL